MAKRKYKHAQCVFCGNLFSPALYNQKTCSPECRLEHGRKKSFDYQRSKREAAAPVAQVSKPHIACEECGATFVAFHSRHKTCSKTCMKAKQKRERPSRAVRSQSLAADVRSCARCSSVFQPRTYQQTYCGPGCKAKNGIAAQAERYVEKRDGTRKRCCGECGTEFVLRDGRQITCSLQCSHKMYSRIGARVRRARMAGVHTEIFDPFEVFDRDGWRCQMCNVSTPRSRRGTLHANAPELDHIKPLSKGGAHTKGNTQCACRACNSWKSDRHVAGQVGLFPALGLD